MVFQANVKLTSTGKRTSGQLFKEIIPTNSSPFRIILIPIAVSNRLNTFDIALNPPFPINLTRLFPIKNRNHAINRFKAKEIKTIYKGNCPARRSSVVMAAGPESNGVPIGTTAIIPSSTSSTQLPVTMNLIEKISRRSPPAIANEPTEIPN